MAFGWLKKLWNGIKNVAGKVWGGFKKIFPVIKNPVKQLVSNFLPGKIANATNLAIDTVSDVIEPTKPEPVKQEPPPPPPPPNEALKPMVGMNGHGIRIPPEKVKQMMKS